MSDQIWHITHRFPKREFLLKFSKDRHRYLQWLYQAKKRYGLAILNHLVTSNYIHLLVVDDGDRDAIPNLQRRIRLLLVNGRDKMFSSTKWSIENVATPGSSRKTD